MLPLTGRLADHLTHPALAAEAIKAVGHVIEHYDTDKSFPAFGFGAALPPANVSHCFALNGNISNPEVAGVAGILQAYRQTLARAKLSGPTFFAPIINTAAQVCCPCTSPPPLARGCCSPPTAHARK